VPFEFIGELKVHPNLSGALNNFGQMRSQYNSCSTHLSQDPDIIDPASVVAKAHTLFECPTRVNSGSSFGLEREKMLITASCPPVTA
jgi:hypothetical protein